MFSVSLCLSTDALEGVVRFCGHSFDALEANGTDSELSVSVCKDGRALNRLRVSVPEGSLKPFSAHTTLLEPTADGTTPQPRDSESEERCLKEPSESDDEQLATRFSALTTSENDSESVERCVEDRTSARLFFRAELLSSADWVAFDPTPPTSVTRFLKDRIRPDDPLHVVCASCNRTISAGTVRFQRVEPCCEGMTSELSGSWFCHSGSTPSGVVSTPSLYFDSVCFYLPRPLPEGLHLLNGSRCEKCGSTWTLAARPDPDFAAFYCDKVEFRGSNPELPEEVPYRFRMAWLILWQMFENAFEDAPVCKLYLQGTGNRCLLLRACRERVPWFLGRSSCSARGRFEPAHRVQYLSCHASDPTVRRWRHLFEVDFFRVSDYALDLLDDCLRKLSFGSPCDAEGFADALLPASLPGAKRVFQ